jgi:multiple sugar transport system ATP-binding protein
MIAGLESITKGNIEIDGKVVNDVSPKDRNIAMVFQNYALYPNFDLYENIAFGLRLRKVEKYKIDELVNEKAKQLQISHLLDRQPKDISGGQRQRVALGRAIVRDPAVFLMDEPLSNLDAKMRVQMRTEIIKLHKQLNATTVYVTHDQTEAMTMGDRIVVMNGGLIQQIGKPEEIYTDPKNSFTAGFIGSPQTNFIRGRITYDNEEFWFSNNYFIVKLPKEKVTDNLKQYVKSDVIGGIRPEFLCMAQSNQNNENDLLKGEVDLVELIGANRYVYVKCGKDTVIVRCPIWERYEIGEKVLIKLDMNVFWFFDPDSGKRIY